MWIMDVDWALIMSRRRRMMDLSLVVVELKSTFVKKDKYMHTTNSSIVHYR